MFIRIIMFSLLIQLPFELFSIEKSVLLKDLDFIGSVFEAKYAPKEWKESYAKWTLEEQLKKTKTNINEKGNITTKDYHQLLCSFFRSTRDYHVSIQFHSSEEACLPFSLYCVKNKYFISDVSKELLDFMVELQLYNGDVLTKGCEILTFDGKPIDSVIRELKNSHVANSKTETAKQLTCRLLTNRKGFLGHPMPKSPTATIAFKTPQNKICSAEIGWIHSPEDIVYKSPFYKEKEPNFEYAYKMMYSPLAAAVLDNKEDVYKRYFERLGINTDSYLSCALSQKMDEVNEENFDENDQDFDESNDDCYLDEDSNSENSSSCEENTEIHQADHSTPIDKSVHVLDLGKKIWKEKKESLYHAYIYRSPKTKKKIGYIRIASYSPTMDFQEFDVIIKNLAKIIKRFECTTEAIVVDQTNNSGGLLLYGYAIASMLTDRPLKVPHHKLTLTPREVDNAVKTIRGLKSQLDLETNTDDEIVTWMQGYPCDSKFFQAYLSSAEFIVNEWNSGKQISSSYPLIGIKRIAPHPMAHYSKPILMLVDCLDFSTADFIPAILQDEKRAVIFGEKTAGAGGSVETCDYPNLLGIASFSFTTSFAERSNGKPIENLGVTPDIVYTKTVKDLTHNLRDYKRAINQAVENLLLP